MKIILKILFSISSLYLTFYILLEILSPLDLWLGFPTSMIVILIMLVINFILWMPNFLNEEEWQDVKKSWGLKHG